MNVSANGASATSAHSASSSAVSRVGHRRRSPPAPCIRSTCIRSRRGRASSRKSRCSSEVAHQRPLAGAAEAGHAVLDVGEEALPGLLAVVADVDAGRRPGAAIDVGGGRLDRGAQLVRVDRLAAAAPAVERGERGRPGQAAGVGDDEAVAGGEHRPVRRGGSAGRWPARPSSRSSATRRHRVRVAEQAVVAVVGVAPGGVERPPRRLEGDAVRVGEVHGPDEAVVDDVGDLAAGVLEAVAQGEQRLLVGQVERQVVELDRPRVGHAGRLGERLDVVVGVLEEGDRALLAEGEEVVDPAIHIDPHPSLHPIVCNDVIQSLFVFHILSPFGLIGQAAKNTIFDKSWQLRGARQHPPSLPGVSLLTRASPPSCVSMSRPTISPLSLMLLALMMFTWPNFGFDGSISVDVALVITVHSGAAWVGKSRLWS